MINRLPRCTSLLEEDMRRGLHIGAQVCVHFRGETIADFALGLARDGRVLRPDHRILWLSAGKPLLAMAIAKLWEENRLSLDSAVADYLPEFSQHGKGNVRISHLLTHTHAYQPP